MDIESLPTGIVIPKAGQNSRPTDLTASNRFESCPSLPEAAIQLAESVISEILLICAQEIFVIASATAILAEDEALIIDSEGFSPMAMASPRIAIKGI